APTAQSGRPVGFHAACSTVARLGHPSYSPSLVRVRAIQAALELKIGRHHPDRRAPFAGESHQERVAAWMEEEDARLDGDAITSVRPREHGQRRAPDRD